jgi:adenylate cyclase
MADLIAQGREPQHRWRRTLPDGESIVVGRTAGGWAVAWDPHVSRQHAELRWNGRTLDVRQLPNVRNPIFYQGRETPSLAIAPGECFVVGDTTFTLADQRVFVTVDAPAPVEQHAFSSQYLKQIPFRNPDHRIEVLSRLTDVISSATGMNELCVRLVSMLLAGVPRAETVAVVACEPASGGEASGSEPSPVEVLHWDQRIAIEGDFQPSKRLIDEATRKKQSVLHMWQGVEGNVSQMFTSRGNYDWAFCTPVLGEACQGWSLYVAGRFGVQSPTAPGTSDPADLREDMKFTELVAGAVSSLWAMQQLHRRHASLSQFFSPVVLETLSHEDPDVVLAPRETEVAVLFCDLRGFSRHTEQHAGSLTELLHRVSGALGVMTHQILKQGGVVGDFQGDAAMGFWGWPLPQPNAIDRTCRAALAIRNEFVAAARDPRSPLAGFHAGIGIATGLAVAGRIGTVDHVKVTVFGPVVNLASRLEGMTKLLRVPILIDRATAAAIRRDVPREVARVRRLAVVRPYGLETPVEASELLPPRNEYPTLTDEHIATYESALDEFLAGRWSEAFELLHSMPADDVATDFLTVYIAQHNRTPPDRWDGVIPLESKGF